MWVCGVSVVYASFPVTIFRHGYVNKQCHVNRPLHSHQIRNACDVDDEQNRTSEQQQKIASATAVLQKNNCNSDESITATIIFLYIYIGGVCYIQFEIENASLWFVTSTVTSCGIQTHNSVLAATQMNGLNDHTVFVVRALEWSQTCLCVSYDMPIIRLKR